jgi:hypothetical protein
MGNDTLRVEEFDGAQAVALGAGAHRVVEREEPRLELGERISALRASEARREHVLLAGFGLYCDGPAIGVAQRRLERLSKPLLCIRAHAQPVDHCLDRVLRVLLQPRGGVEIVHLAVDTGAREALRAQLVEQLGLLAAARRDDRRKHHQARVLGKPQHMVDHLRDRLGFERQAVVGTVRRPGTGIQEPQVVVDLGDRADRRARVVAGRLLLDRDRRRKPSIRSTSASPSFPGTGARTPSRFDVAPLPFRVQRVEGK